MQPSSQPVHLDIEFYLKNPDQQRHWAYEIAFPPGPDHTDIENDGRRGFSHATPYMKFSRVSTCDPKLGKVTKQIHEYTIKLLCSAHKVASEILNPTSNENLKEISKEFEEFVNYYWEEHTNCYMYLPTYQSKVVRIVDLTQKIIKAKPNCLKKKIRIVALTLLMGSGLLLFGSAIAVASLAGAILVGGSMLAVAGASLGVVVGVQLARNGLLLLFAQRREGTSKLPQDPVITERERIADLIIKRITNIQLYSIHVNCAKYFGISPAIPADSLGV